MPRAKASKKLIPVVGENGTDTINGVSEEDQVTLAKPKGRVGKKTKENIEKPIKPAKEEDAFDVNKKSKKKRGATKENANNDDQNEPQEIAEVLKKTTKVKGKTSNKESVVTEVVKSKVGRSNKKEQKSDNFNAKDNDELVTKTAEKAKVATNKKSGTARGAKKDKNLSNSVEAEIAPSPEKVVTAKTKGRKKKEVNVVQKNEDDAAETVSKSKEIDNAFAKDNKMKEAPKRGRGKKQETAIEPEKNIEESPKKKQRIETEEPVKKNKRIKKTDEQNDIIAEKKTKKTSTKKGEAGSSKEDPTTSRKPSGRKRNVANLEDEEDSKPKKSKTLLNPTETLYNKADFELSVSPADGNVSNVSSNGGDYQKTILKISSWNVAGLRSWLKKDGLKYLEYEEPDIFCLQEIKCKIDQLPDEAARIPGYHPYWLGLSGGYGGVALYSKIMPINVEYGIGDDEFDEAGHIITAEYEKFYLINVYVPNSGQKLAKLDARMRWEKLFQAYVKKLDSLKPLIITGDMNVSHKEIDLSNPKSNTRHAGFTIEEREKMTELLALGFVDTYRHLYPDKTGAYTFWTYFANARARNIGWRLDYFLVSERILKRVIDNAIRSQCLGSDHCPITLFINI